MGERMRGHISWRLIMVLQFCSGEVSVLTQLQAWARFQTGSVGRGIYDRIRAGAAPAAYNVFGPWKQAMISTERFEELVDEALASIPDEFWQVVDNLAVTVSEWPSRAQLASTGTRMGYTLLGLYEGIPLTERTQHYGLVPPDKITIFRGPILRMCAPGDETAVREQVRRTVVHEVAHHFGISDERLRELGAY